MRFEYNENINKQTEKFYIEAFSREATSAEIEKKNKLIEKYRKINKDANEMGVTICIKE